MDHASAYYHYGLAKLYEEQAAGNGRQDLATQAIEQYKLALDADPDSRVLQDGIANLYFRLGRIREAVSAAQDQVNKHPDDVEAHMLLGRVYLRTLGDGQGQQASDILQAAIKEYEVIAKLKPNDLETRLLLGQLDVYKRQVRFSCRSTCPGEISDISGCVKVWLPISWPSRYTRSITLTLSCATSPIMKNVPTTWYFFSTSRIFGVHSGSGPSSKVSATCFGWYPYCDTV